jgi:hypothetical protein
MGEPFIVKVTSICTQVIREDARESRINDTVSGSTPHRTKTAATATHAFYNNGILEINNQDTYCFFYAAEMARLKTVMNTDQYRRLCANPRKQKDQALWLMNKIRAPHNMPTYNSMKSGKRKDFILWYGQNYNNRFDLKEKLVDYCLSDVRLLSEGLVRYRQIMLSECKFDVLRKCTTLAGTMMTHFRMNHLKTDGPKIGVASELSYERHDKQSTIARKFLKWTAAKHNIDI